MIIYKRRKECREQKYKQPTDNEWNTTVLLSPESYDKCCIHSKT